MTIRQVHFVQNHQVIIDLPKDFKDKQRVLVIVEDSIDDDKMQLMKEAANDPMFIADMKEVQDDFGHLDKEI